jgi:hypothetical protein
MTQYMELRDAVELAKDNDYDNDNKKMYILFPNGKKMYPLDPWFGFWVVEGVDGFIPTDALEDRFGREYRYRVETEE